MKKYNIRMALFLLSAMGLGLINLSAQEKKTNVLSEISYRVISSAISPIEGESHFVTGEVEFNDDTNELERLNFEVPVNSFTGFNSEYLAWISDLGRAGNLNLSFEGKSIEKKGDRSYIVKGNLNFRNNSRPIEISMRKKVSSNQLILTGDFNLRVRDYFIGRDISRQIVPGWIPFQVTLAFDNNFGSNVNIVS